MPEWARQLITLRRETRAEPLGPIVEAIREARAFGTTLVGDVGNSVASFEPLADSELSGVIFRELLGFNVADPGAIVAAAAAELAALTSIARLRTSVVPHAPYSVSPGLFRAIAAAAGDRPVTVHAGESESELRFLHDGSGPWRNLLERLGVWDPGWSAPACGPIEFLDRLGLVHERLLAVHGVHFTDPDLDRLAQAGATVVTCPRSNKWTGAGDPPVERFYRSGVRVAVGTDSLASVDDLNVFGELAAMRRLAPGIAAARLLRSATLDGASALGFGSELGSIEPGKRAELLAVRVPGEVEDVEEYLVSGIEADDIRWLGAGGEP
jgi:cytosine/adenosine deaminase-related metal-dependent hydrolase